MARPRVGLLGNPSDGYGGRVLAFTFEDFRAEARVEPAESIVLEGPGSEPLHAGGWADLLQRPPRSAGAGAVSLLLAAAQIFATEVARMDSAATPRRSGLRLQVSSDIPRQVGFAGSSAIIIAALRALTAGHAIEVPPMELARLALRAECDLLGIAAGPQDRVVQAHEGLWDMDFAREPWTAQPLDPSRLPPLFIAWDLEPGESSGATHGDLRTRWKNHDPEVREAMTALRSLVAEGRRHLESGDGRALRLVVDRNFDIRAALCRLPASACRIVRIGREHGAGVKFCGSGGAVVGIVDREAGLAEVEAAYRESGFGFLRPRPSRVPTS